MDAYDGQALITFTYDDGRLNNYENALRLHEQWSVPAVFAIIAGRALSDESSDRYMTAFEVGDAARRGVEIASHSMTHSRRFTEMDDGELESELVDSQRHLEAMVPRNSRVSTLCIPFSKADDRVLKAALSRYRYVRVAGKRLNAIDDEARVINSHPVTNETTAAEIRSWIDRAVSERRWLVLMFHGVRSEGSNLGKYDTRAERLENILKYVAELSPQRILPVNFEQASQIYRNEKAKRLRVLQAGERPSSTVISEASGHLITYHRNEARSDKLVISFGGLPSKKTRVGFGSSFVLAQGWDHIFVAQEALTQYQGLSIEEFESAVAPIASGYDTFAYGSSLGAYAALYYGGSIDARIIAAAPKNSAHPLVLQKRFSHLEFVHDELVDVKRSAHSPVILYDPHRRDESRFIRKLVSPAYPDAQLVELPYAGHTVLETMKRMGCLKEFMRSYIERHEILDVEINESGLEVFPAERGRELLAGGDVESALSMFQESLAIGFNVEAGSGQIKALLKLGRTEEATRALSSYEALNGSLRGIPHWVRDAVS